MPLKFRDADVGALVALVFAKRDGSMHYAEVAEVMSNWTGKVYDAGNVGSWVSDLDGTTKKDNYPICLRKVGVSRAEWIDSKENRAWVIQNVFK